MTDGSGERSRNESTTNAKTPTAATGHVTVDGIVGEFAAAYEEQMRKSRKVTSSRARARDLG